MDSPLLAVTHTKSALHVHATEEWCTGVARELNIAHFYRAPLCQSHRGASATAKVYNVTYTARDRITPKQCTYRQWGNAVRGIQTSILLERNLTNEFCSNFL